MNAPSAIAAYYAGRWIPVCYGMKFRLAKKGENFPLPHAMTAGRGTEIDPSQTFDTFAEAQTAADLRNAKA